MYSDLGSRLRTLMAFRIVMVTTLLFLAAYVEALSEALVAVNPLYFVIATTYLLTVVYALALRLLPHGRWQAYVQVAGDLLTITSLVYVTGSARTGFLLLYPLSVLSATVLVSRRGALSLAGLATACYACLLVLVRFGLPAPPGFSDVPALPTRAVVYAVFVLGVACITVAVLGAYLVDNLKHASRQLSSATAEVADLRELNQVIVDSIQSGLLTADVEGRVLHLNGFGERVLGYRVAALRGSELRQLLGSPLLGPAELRARVADGGSSRLEVRYAHPDGRRLELGISVAPLAATGAARGYLLVFQDLTGIRALEAEVRTNEKLAAVGEMAAELAHEIRNPLGSIRGSAQVLMGERALGEEQFRLLEIISRESKRLSDTLNRFLYQARTSRASVGPVDLHPVIESAVTLLRNGADVGPAHQVCFESDRGPHMCMADPDQISQVFWNLARNGLEAMPNGGRLDVALRSSGGNLILTIRDEGRGMRCDEQRRVSEPVARSSRLSGGLGLAIVFQIVRQHGGDVVVRSDPQQGTQFDVRLPLAREPESASSGDWAKA